MATLCGASLSGSLRLIAVVPALCAAALAGCSPAAGSEGTPPQRMASSATPSVSDGELLAQRIERVNADAATVAEFQERVKDYWKLHEKLSAGLPKLGEEASPAEVDQHQRELARRLSEARAAAKPGDVFTPAMTDFVRKLFIEVFSGTDGKRMRSTVMDENPVGTPVKVNGRYPDTVPRSTMPPDVLKSLPPTPEGLEYRFVGRRLVLLDVPANLIIDFVDNALPA